MSSHRPRSTLGSVDNLNGSESYVWSTSSSLGRGSTAVVYQGVHKLTGEPAAIKTFTAPGGLQRQQLNELELLQKLEHENVVKLLAIETEAQTGNKVAIMELCEGRSLFSILDDPENAYGLNEKEFLLVLGHMAAGLRYLRDNDISHRDLKPGNIVKFITDDGRHIYKLTDFGAARALADNECFYSLCGTEEYLYPDIYDKAVMKSSEKKAFSPKVDLWSMGCTIYHVATGSLPFRPYRGRENRQGMHFIHLNKQPGVISAIQYENGRVEWSRELPKTCLLSHGLREVVTPMLQSLLEKEKTWSFKDFFSEVDKLLTKKPFHVFDAHTCMEHTLYLDPGETIQGFQVQLKMKTQIPVENQLLVQKGSSLEKLDPNAQVCTSIETTASDPIILLSSASMGMRLPADKASLPSVSFPEFEIGAAYLDHDVLKAKNFTSASYTVGRNVERMTRCHNLLLEVPPALTTIINSRIDKLLQCVQQSVERAAILECILNPLTKYVGVMTEVVSLFKIPNCPEVQRLSTIIQDRQQDVATIMEEIDTVRKRALILQEKYFPDQKKDDRWQQGVQHCNRLTGRKETADTYVRTIRSSWQQLDKFKSMKPLSFNEEQFHQLEKNKMNRTKEKLLEVHTECSKALKLVARELDSWYSEAHAAFVQCQCLTVELNQGITHLKNFEQVLKNSEDECEVLVKKCLSATKNCKYELTNEQASPPLNGMKPEIQPKQTSALLQELEDLKKSQNDIKSQIQDNYSVINELQQLTSQLSYLRSDNSIGNEGQDLTK